MESGQSEQRSLRSTAPDRKPIYNLLRVSCNRRRFRNFNLLFLWIMKLNVAFLVVCANELQLVHLSKMRIALHGRVRLEWTLRCLKENGLLKSIVGHRQSSICVRAVNRTISSANYYTQVLRKNDWDCNLMQNIFPFHYHRYRNRKSQFA